MFKKFQTGGMMNPQQGQMLPPDPQQMAPQPQGGAQLPPEVMQILMTLPENIRQYLLSLPPDQMMMELQKIMQEQMASQSSPLSQQQGQGQQGPSMPPQGDEQVAPPMMGKYGMKMRAKMGLTTDPKAKIDLGKMEDSSDIRLAQQKINPYLMTKPKTTTPTVAPVVQPTINSNPNAPKLGQKVMLNGKAATIDMVDGKLVFKYDDGSGIQEVRIAQTTPTLSQGAAKVGNIDNNQTSVQQGIVSTPAAKTTKTITTKPKTTTTQGTGTGTGNNVPTNTNTNIMTNESNGVLDIMNNYPNIKNFVNSDDGYKAIKNNNQKSLRNVSISNNNFKDADKVLKAQFDLEIEKENLEKQLSIIDTVPDSMFKYSSRIAEKEKLKIKLNSIKGQLVQVEKIINSQSFNSNYSKSKYKEAYDNVAKNKNQDNANKDLLAVASSYKKQRLLDKYSSKNAINNLDFLKPKEKELTPKERVEQNKLKNIKHSRRKIPYITDNYSLFKSGGQLPSALKVSTPLKTIMDRKIEMYKSGGKMKLKTCKHGC